MDVVAILDELLKRCPQKEGCSVLSTVREKLMAGEWGDALRLLQQGVGTCGSRVRQCSDVEALF